MNFCLYRQKMTLDDQRQHSRWIHLILFIYITVVNVWCFFSSLNIKTGCLMVWNIFFSLRLHSTNSIGRLIILVINQSSRLNGVWKCVLYGPKIMVTKAAVRCSRLSCIEINVFNVCNVMSIYTFRWKMRSTMTNTLIHITHKHT